MFSLCWPCMHLSFQQMSIVSEKLFRFLKTCFELVITFFFSLIQLHLLRNRNECCATKIVPLLS
jgi:hypothetical protein